MRKSRENPAFFINSKIKLEDYDNDSLNNKRIGIKWNNAPEKCKKGGPDGTRKAHP